MEAERRRDRWQVREFPGLTDLDMEIRVDGRESEQDRTTDGPSPFRMTAGLVYDLEEFAREAGWEPEGLEVLVQEMAGCTIREIPSREKYDAVMRRLRKPIPEGDVR